MPHPLPHPHGPTLAVNLVPLNATLNDCVTTCAAAWQGTVQVGQWALCAAEDANRRYYGTWRPDRKQCWYYNATLVPVPPPTGTLKPVGTTQAPRPGVAVKCGCTRPAVPVEWQADAGCMGGASAAAVGPATCRFKKLGTADNAGQWTIGWAALVKRGTASVIVCHSATVYYGLNGAPLTTVDWGTPGHNVQLLCKGARCDGEGQTAARLHAAVAAGCYCAPCLQPPPCLRCRLPPAQCPPAPPPPRPNTALAARAPRASRAWAAAGAACPSRRCEPAGGSCCNHRLPALPPLLLCQPPGAAAVRRWGPTVYRPCWSPAPSTPPAAQSTPKATAPPLSPPPAAHLCLASAAPRPRQTW